MNAFLLGMAWDSKMETPKGVAMAKEICRIKAENFTKTISPREEI